MSVQFEVRSAGYYIEASDPDVVLDAESNPVIVCHCELTKGDQS